MKKLLLITLGLGVVINLYAQIRGNSVVVTVEPDHADWRYDTGDKVIYNVEVRQEGSLVKNVSVDYAMGPEMYQNIKKSVVLKDGKLKLTGSMSKPGFYRLDVTAHVNGTAYKGACGVGFNPEKLLPSTVMPKDFEQFWLQSIEQARKISLEPTKRLLPERCTQDVNVYEVSFNSEQWGMRVYGILCVPVKAGRYPALLRVPGAGVRPYGGDVYTASKGVITLEIGIHGIPVTMEQSVYDNLGNAALKGYWEYNMDSRDKHYYHHVIMGCIRAMDYIEQYTPWDGMKAGVTGSSQGGFLTLATAGLDKRITCYAPVHAALCDHTNSLRQAACGWPHYFYWNKGVGQEKQIEVSRYYDGVNFARLINANQTGWFSFGYNDDVVPPTTAWATYNSVTGPKMIKPYQATWHFWHQEQWDEWEAWLLRELRETKAAQLEERLKCLQKRGYMAGHQDDPFYGIGWAYEDGKSDVRLTVGDYPAVMGFELGGIEMADEKNLDSVPFRKIHDELIAHVKRGGVVTISWHPRNPLTGGTAWDVTNKTVVKSILPGGQCAEKFSLWMKRLADFIETLKDDNGTPVPVIFRPWHENNGSWFWWGQNLCTDTEFKALWNLLQDYMNMRGFSNLLWSYSPNLDGGWTLERFLRRYPGNDRVMLIGEDAYQWGTEAEFIKAVNSDLTFLSKFANDNGKLLAMTECGLKNIPDATWFSRVLKPQMDKYPISYFLLWRNDEKEWFGPVPNTPCGEDYKAFKKADNVLFLENLNN